MATLMEMLDSLLGPRKGGNPGGGNTSSGALGGSQSGNIQAQQGRKNIEAGLAAERERGRKGGKEF